MWTKIKTILSLALAGLVTALTTACCVLFHQKKTAQDKVKHAEDLLKDKKKQEEIQDDFNKIQQQEDGKAQQMHSDVSAGSVSDVLSELHNRSKDRISSC